MYVHIVKLATIVEGLYCWVLSKEVSSTIFKVFGMTRPRIEPKSPKPLVNTLPTRPMSWLCNYICLRMGVCVYIYIYIYVCVCVCVCVYIYVFIYIYKFCKSWWLCDVEFYSDLKRSTSRSLSSVEGCYVECVSLRAVWHLTLHLNESRLRLLFEAYDKQTNNMEANLGLDWPQTLVRRCQFTFTYTTKSFVFLPPQITEELTSRLDNINSWQISKSSCNV